MSRTRLAVGALTTAALLATSACGGDVTGDENESGGGVAKVGAILSMTGIYSTLGPVEKKAMEMGVEALNKSGFKVDGNDYTLEVAYADDKSAAATTGIAHFRQMAQTDELPVIAIGLGSQTYAPLLQRYPIPLINILDSTYYAPETDGAPEGILQYDEHLFLTRGAASTYVPGCVRYAKEELGVKSIAYISAKGETYSEGNEILVRKSAENEGVEYATLAEYPVGATDFGNAIAEATATKPDAIYIGSVTGIVLPVLKQLRQAGYTGPVFHSSGVTPNQAEAILGSDFNSIMKDNYDCAGTLPTTSENAATTKFAEDFQAKYDEYPQDLTMWAYDYPFVVAAAMAEAGSTTDPEKINEALKAIDVPEGTISGWLPTDGKLFDERNARTLSEVTMWCDNAKTIATAMVFDAKDSTITETDVRKDPCASVG